MKLAEIFDKAIESPVFSFEVFPPKPTAPENTIYDTLDKLSGLNPDFISVTYGAGGGTNRDKTVEIAAEVKNKYGIESLAHLPCVGMSQSEVKAVLQELEGAGIENILALRGDITSETIPHSDFSYANELIEFIKQNGDFNITAACYPEGHPESSSLVSDVKNMKLKVEAGADHFITQMFLDNDYFYAFRERTSLAGIDVPISAGIMPVTNKKQIERMVSLCGIELPPKFIKMIEKYGDNPPALRDAGIAYANGQIIDLITQGVDGIHLYTMNSPYIAERVCCAVHSLICV